MGSALQLRWLWLLLACGTVAACMPQPGGGGQPRAQEAPRSDAGLSTFELGSSGEVHPSGSAPRSEPRPGPDPAHDAGTGSEGSGADAGTAEPGVDAALPTEPDEEAWALEPCGNSGEDEAVRLTNEQRRRAGLPALVCEPDITRAARAHGQDMCSRRYFAHTSPEGWTVADRLREQGVVFRIVGENLASGDSAAAVIESWMQSDGHRRNLLSGIYGRIGIGYVDCGGFGLWTQDFAD